MAHKYYLLYRPPMYGTMPNGHTAIDCPQYRQEYQTSYGEPILAHGWVEYPEPLTPEQVWKWEFAPDDPVEFAHFQFYMMVGRDVEDQNMLERDYVKMYKMNGWQVSRFHDNMLLPAKILSEAVQP